MINISFSTFYKPFNRFAIIFFSLSFFSFSFRFLAWPFCVFIFNGNYRIKAFSNSIVQKGFFHFFYTSIEFFPFEFQSIYWKFISIVQCYSFIFKFYLNYKKNSNCLLLFLESLHLILMCLFQYSCHRVIFFPFIWNSNEWAKKNLLLI